MDPQWTSARAPHCVVLLLILLSQWAVEYASSDLPFPLLMLIVIDISCTQRTRPGPLCSGPENHRTLATIKSFKRCNNPPRDITIAELQASRMLQRWPHISEKILFISKGFDRQVFFVCEGLQHSSSAHLSFLSTFLQSSIHLSVHSSLHPSVHIALCSTCGSICQGLRDACALIYRHLSPTFHLFQIA